MKKVLSCVGTRPNFIKITQLEKEFNKYPLIEYKLLHTGQHFDDNMSEVFFKQLDIRKPDVFLNINKGSQTEIISGIMTSFEAYLISYKPDLVLVPGDVNSSFACAFVANRLGIPIGHIESGLRSYDKTMPEEINRLLIDDITDIFFVTEQSGIDNLIKDGKEKSKIFFTGNTMIDTLVYFMPVIDKSDILKILPEKHKPIATLTFHRPSNVDDKENLGKLLSILKKLSESYSVVFPIHPRTRANITKFGLNSYLDNNPDITLTEPLGYIDFLKLVKESSIVITDSGGIQEETTFLSIPCLTLRTTTERPVTIIKGTNTLLDLDEELVFNEIRKIQNNTYKKGSIPELWDGKSSERIVKAIAEYFNL